MLDEQIREEYTQEEIWSDVPFNDDHATLKDISEYYKQSGFTITQISTSERVGFYATIKDDTRSSRTGLFWKLPVYKNVISKALSHLNGKEYREINIILEKEEQEELTRRNLELLGVG